MIQLSNSFKKIFLAVFLLTSFWISASVQAKNEAVETNAVQDQITKAITDFLPSNTSEVIFDGQFLFAISGDEKQTSKERAETANSKLDKILAQIIKTGNKPRVRTSMRNGFRVLTIDREFLLAITEEDLHNSQHTKIDDLADEWEQKLEKAFQNSINERSNDYLRESIWRVGLILLVTILSSIIVYFLARKVLRGKIFIILAGLWLFSAVKALSLFPQTRPLQYLMERGLLKPLFILFFTIWFVTILNKISYVVINWYFRHSLPEAWSATNRKLNRALTLKKVAETTSDWIFTVSGFLAFLLLNGVNVSSVATGAGIVGLAVGFIAQDLIKGLLNGFSILVEDQFGVGDIIRVGNYAGTVEDFTLRVTRLRNMEGILISIPNKDIGTVENLTNNFSQVDFCVEVDYNTDMRDTLTLMEEIGNQLYKEWPDKILQEPEMLGVDKMKESGVILRMAIKTLPMQQWKVSRELNLRILEAFERKGIKIPVPQMEVRILNEELQLPAVLISGKTKSKKLADLSAETTI